MIAGNSFNSRPSCDGRLQPIRKPRFRRVSIHARLATGDCAARVRHAGNGVSIHARLATGDGDSAGRAALRDVSIHARLATGDHMYFVRRSSSRCFNSRPSCDGRLIPSLPAAWRRDVSIHARLATGDLTSRCFRFVLWSVSIHARLATGDRTPSTWPSR